MDYTQFMTHDEAAVLAAVLLDGGKDEELMNAFWEFDFDSKYAECIAYAIDSVHINGQSVDVITVFEELVSTDDSEACPITLLNSICQSIQPRAKVMEIMRGAA